MDIWLVRENVPELTQRVKEFMLRRVEEREPPHSIWFTDTVYCGRKKIFRLLGLGKQHYTEQALNRLWLGLLIHAELEKLGIEREVKVEYKGIRGKIDCLTETGEPVEIKAVSNIYVASSRYAELHVQQLSRYALALGRETGVLFYYVPGVKLTSMPAHRYRFRLDEVRRETDERIELLKKAWKARDPFILPPTWHSNSLDNWECKSCPYRSLCEQGSLSILG